MRRHSLTPAQPHIVVVGAGIVGAAIAHRLARRGARVSVIEAQGPAAGASGSSFGWINASFYLNEAHFRLRHAGMQAYRALEAEIATGIAWQGAISWEEAGPAQEARGAELACFGYRVEVLEPRAFAALCPALPPPPRALHFAEEGAVEPRAADAGAAACGGGPGRAMLARRFGDGVSARG